MQGRIYTVVADAVAVTAAQDLFEITPADDKPVRLHALYISQTSDTGDAAEELLKVSVIRGHTTGGSGGTAPTPRPINRSDAAAGFTAEVNNTTIASVGTTHTLHIDAWNVRIPYALIWTPELRPEASQGDTTIVVRITAPVDSLTLNATLYVEELG